MLDKVVSLLLVSAAMSMQELDEATSSCSSEVAAQPRSSLLQREKSFLQMARSPRSQERRRWTGSSITIDFTSQSPDMKNVAMKTKPDFSYDGTTVTTVDKTWYQLSFANEEGGQVFSDSNSDKVNLYGFKPTASGLINSNENRIWTASPTKSFAKQVSGIEVTGVPGVEKWKYNVVLGKNAGEDFHMYPSDQIMKRNGTSLYVTFECFGFGGKVCDNGDVVISKIIFTVQNPVDKAKIADPEDVVATTLVSQLATEEEQTSKERWQSLRGRWTGESAVTVDFRAKSADMAVVGSKTVPDFNYDGKNVSKIDKIFYEVSFAQTDEGHSLSDISGDKINIFGFHPGSNGLINSNQDRLWTAEPTEKNSTLVYGIMVSNVPKIQKWKYSIEFGKPPPEDLKVYPSDGTVERDEKNLYLTLECSSALTCIDGDILISQITFSPAEEKNAKRDFTPSVAQMDAKKMDEKKSQWSGQAITIDFDSKSTDMDLIETKSMRDWYLTEAVKVNKSYLEAMVPVEDGGQATCGKDGVRVFGFQNKTSGIANDPAARVWTAKPNAKGAKLVYGIQVLNVGPVSEWNYSISYLLTPPSKLKVYPADGSVKRSKKGHLYVAFVCDDDTECNANSLTISKATFTPQGKLQTPEQLAKLHKDETIVINSTVDDTGDSGLREAMGH